MRDLLAHADLTRYAGQFVWLELSFDEPRNSDFLGKYGANATPTFFVIDPHDEKVLAMQPGVMSLAELKQFLERGERAMFAPTATPADAALVRGDALMAQHPVEAADEYQRALQQAPVDWPRRPVAEASYVQALENSQQWQRCAGTAVNYARAMKRDVLFVRTVVSGMWCLASADPAPWVNTEADSLSPLAEEALSLPFTVRDHRDSLYRTLMELEVARKHNAAALNWGNRWLAELDEIKPRSEDERTALDIARVENVQIAGDAARILPALKQSEQAMSRSYNASLRLAQMELAAKHYDQAVSACRRGLARRPGAVGQTWLLSVEAHALKDSGRTAEARRVLQRALTAAGKIPSKESREKNLAAINKLLEAGPEAVH